MALAEDLQRKLQLARCGSRRQNIARSGNDCAASIEDLTLLSCWRAEIGVIKEIERLGTTRPKQQGSRAEAISKVCSP